MQLRPRPMPNKPIKGATLTGTCLLRQPSLRAHRHKLDYDKNQINIIALLTRLNGSPCMFILASCHQVCPASSCPSRQWHTHSGPKLDDADRINLRLRQPCGIRMMFSCSTTSGFLGCRSRCCVEGACPGGEHFLSHSL